jgi:UDP-N-acetylglucosamine:LPS N-acetylglucosamine transferase
MNQPLDRKTIDLVYFNAGGGHRAAATALEAVIREQGRPWQVRLVNFMKILDPKDVFLKTTGMNWEDIYNSRLARGWSVGLAQELKLLQALIRLSHKSVTGRLRRHWRRTRPDMVVSLIPNFNRPMYEALRIARPQAPYVTIMTDFADFPPHFWVEPRQDQHFVCGTPHAVAQVRAMGYAQARIHATSGMIIRPDFYRDLPLDRRAERRSLGLDPDRPTGIVMFGGHGSRVMQSIARRLGDTQLILICGHNASLAQRLNEMSAEAPRLVLGFTSEIRRYMQLSDFFIGKPGPGSISEAVQQGLPVAVVRNTWTMPQERYNTDWVRENQAGIVMDSYRGIRAGVAELIARLDEFRGSISHIQNRAVFEIPRILEQILQTEPASAQRIVPTHEHARGGATLH